MPIASASFQLTVAATANETAALTTRTAQTSKRDTITFANGTGSLSITGVVDTQLTIAANSTVTALSSLADTLETAFAFTALKAYRVSTPSTNAADVTVTSNITGFLNGTVLHPNATIGGFTAFANGTTVAGANTITVAGNNNDTVNVTLYLS
jgi:hypothetical protein